MKGLDKCITKPFLNILNIGEKKCQVNIIEVNFLKSSVAFYSIL